METFNNIDWLKKLHNASSNRERTRELRRDIFEDTVEYVLSGGYDTGYKEVAIDNSIIISEYFTAPQKLISKGQHNAKFSVINADCLETAEITLNSGFNPCVLNLASGRNPGGGVLNGAAAQEENIFRRTNLFMSLYQYASYAADYGITRNKNSYPIHHQTGGIYSGNITVFRGSEKNGYCLLNRPYKMAFVTVPAISHPRLFRVSGEYYLDEAYAVQTKEKIRTILRIAGKHKHDCLILGAFGCGAFENPPNHIAKLFKEVFSDDEFSGVFKYIVFSIFEDHNSGREHNPNGNVLPFFETFDKM
jgi:uncharacterized protein (TIGR02452 family)